MNDKSPVSEPEWRAYKVGEKSKRPNWTEQTCQPFSHLYHIAHIDHAYDIVRNQEIQSYLVQDKSILNKERISVVWLSPNDWYQGSMYGNIRFCLDLNDVISGMSFYWVEVMKEYTPVAPRILITDKNHPDLSPYDPTVGDGPWWHDVSTNTHYRNGDFNLEFMLERDVQLKEVKEYDFVKHHESFCNKKDKGCAHKGWTPEKAGGVFVAGITGNEIKVGVASFESAYQKSWYEFARWIKAQRYTYAGNLVHTGVGKTIAKAYLAAYSRYDYDGCREIAGLFLSLDALLEACAVAIEWRLKGSRGWHLFRDSKEQFDSD